MKRKFTKKDIWRLYPVLIFIGILLFFHLKGRKETKDFFNSPLANIVVKKDNWQRRVTQFILNNNIRIESSVIDGYDITIGDSIVKEANSYTFRVYRKDSTDNYKFVKQYTIDR